MENVSWNIFYSCSLCQEEAALGMWHELDLFWKVVYQLLNEIMCATVTHHFTEILFFVSKSLNIYLYLFEATEITNVYSPKTYV